MIQNIPDDLISRLSEFVRAQTGLYFPKEKWRDLRRGIIAAAQELDFEDTESFAHWLLLSPPTKRQLNTLVGHLTIGETFFFRDKNLFQVLRDNILSGWTASRHGRGKSIRFWSAGCCTGEEPYSIAMLVDQMMPALKDWKITILATDINAHFLQKAKEGAYTRWSFRDTPERIVEKYFRKRGENRFEISPHLKEMVDFCQLNLAENGYPSPLNNTHSMDVIFCRNVVMYFVPELRTQVIQRLARSLVKGGWLIVGPSETAFVQHPGLNAVRLPGAILHRKGLPRKEDSVPTRARPASRVGGRIVPLSRTQTRRAEGTGYEQKPARRRTDRKPEEKSGKKRDKPKQEMYQEALNLYEKGRYEESAEKLGELFSNDQSEDEAFLLNPEAMAFLAKSLANLGKLNEAKKWCERAVNAEKLHPGHYYLMATICQEQGLLEESSKSLKQALYLHPEFVLAHFALANLTQQQNNFDAAKRHLKNALSLLLSMDSEEILPHSEGLTAGRLREAIGLMIDD